MESAYSDPGIRASEKTAADNGSLVEYDEANQSMKGMKNKHRKSEIRIDELNK